MSKATRATVGGSSANPWTLLGLALGAAGIAVLWAAGQEFPVYPPPGILILLAGALFVWLAPWRWTPAVGAFLGLFVIVGFVAAGFASDTGFGNITGAEGAARAAGAGLQMIGVTLAFVAGTVATRAAHLEDAPQGVSS